MQRQLQFLTVVLIAASIGAPANGQALIDTLFSWQGYGRTGACRVLVYRTPPGNERTHTVVIREIAENTGPTAMSDARHLVELIGRGLNVDPDSTNWIFHYGDFSYPGARSTSRKELFLRATFRRTRSGSLGAPSWHVITRADVEDLTDRLFR